MVVLIVVLVAVVAFAATYVVEAVSNRRKARLAETSTASGRGGERDGMTNPIAAEGVYREGARNLDPGVWGQP
jgi:hypothetical protein